MKDLTDQQLVEKALQDISYFKILVDRYHQQIKRFVMRISNIDEDESHDVLQEVFIKAWKNIESYNPAFSFSSWLYSIARNETINYYKKHIKKTADNTLQVSTEQLESIAEHFDQSGDFDRKLQKKRVVDAIQQLDEKYREIIILHFFEHKSYREVSDILKLPLGTVNSMFKKANQILFSKLYDVNKQ